MGVEPGDEVIVPPYTFIATVNVVLRQYALPVFVDSDRETMQMDARKLEAAITPATKAIIPVHLGGSVCDLDAILAIAANTRCRCSRTRARRTCPSGAAARSGSYGQAGCFSFQASKNLNSGEGGAVICNDEELRERCHAFHNNGSGLAHRTPNFAYTSTGTNLRMTEFQAALLLAQMTRIEQQAKVRTENALYLTSMLKEIAGIAPARMYDGCTRNAYHLYMFRYDQERFGGRPRAAFLKALAAEGIPASGGYTPLNTQPFLKTTLQSRGYQRLFPSKVLAGWAEHNRCPANDRLCEEAVWFTQTCFWGRGASMERIAPPSGRSRRPVNDRLHRC